MATTAQQHAVLVVDDEDAHRLMLREALRRHGYRVLEAGSGEAALGVLREEACDLVLLDLKMPGMGGLETLRHIRGLNPSLPVLIMTAYATVQTAVQAIKEGAVDYLTKPLDLPEVYDAIRSAIEPGEEEEAAALPPELNDMELVVSSSVMRGVLDDIVRVAGTDATVLLTGESGTGKDVFAQAIHRLSARAAGPMVSINCAAIPEALVESELFGHRRGAFTGADRDKDGKFILANGGTLFLDEVGELPLPMQAKLLRVLQDGRITPVGGSEVLQADVRIVAATNRDLEMAVRDRAFREDLYYRLSVFPIRVPPLRERKIDIPPMAEKFLRSFSIRHGKEIKAFSPRAMAALLSYDWPGNVRELMNVVERGVILTRSASLGIEDLPATLTGGRGEGFPPEAGLRPGMSLKEMERILIAWTLEEKKGNRTRAARTLGITRKTLLAKMKEYGIE